MSDCLKKIIISFLNLLFPGLGFAVSAQLDKAFLLMLLLCILQLSGFIFFQYFWGFLLISALIFLVKFYAVITPFWSSNLRFVSYWKNGIIFILSAEIIFAAIASLVSGYAYEAYKIHNLTSQKQIVQNGEYIMVSKKHPYDKSLLIATDLSDGKTQLFDMTLLSDNQNIRPLGTPLYIIFSRDFSRIGQPIKKQPATENESGLL